MEIIKVDQLSFAARAGALDGSLAYANVYQQHQTLISQTALSGLAGLQQTLSETGIYGLALRSLQEMTTKIPEANELALKDPFQASSSSQRDQHYNAMVNGFRAQGGPYYGTAQVVDQRAQSHVNNTAPNTPERTLANDLKWAAAELFTLGTGYLVNQGDPNNSRHHAQVARQAASEVQGKALALLNTLSNTQPFPAERYNQVLNIYYTSGDVINHAINVIDFDNNAPISKIRFQTPTTHDLGDGYSLSTWGNTGYWTLTDSSGAGILVQPDGSVNNLNGGSGWKFSSTSTFVLPNQTKITVEPGSSSNLLITRGVHAFTINNMSLGGWPSTSSYEDLNGRDADRSTNDGHILQMGGSAYNWSNNGNYLGDIGGREVIGTVAITNELKLDPTDVSISSEMQGFLNQLGFTDYDYDGDGKLNNIELLQVANYTTTYIKQIQDAYEQTLARIAAANQALTDLNDIIDLLKKETERQSESRGLNDATAKAELVAIERRLVAALQLLKGDGSTIPLTGDIKSNATQLLGQITDLTQSGDLQPLATSGSTNPVIGSDPSGNTQPESSVPGQSTDPIGDSLRRASRLLSGILGGGNLNILELPPQPGAATTSPTNPEISTQTGDPTTPPTTVTPDSPTETTPTLQGQVPQSTGTTIGNPTEPTEDTASGPPLGSVASGTQVPASVPSVNQGSPPDNPLLSLINQLTALVPTTDSQVPVSPQDLAVGLQSLLLVLAQMNLFPTSSQQDVAAQNTPSSPNLTSTDSSSPPLTFTGPSTGPSAPSLSLSNVSSLRDFLASLSTLGTLIQTTSAQPNTPLPPTLSPQLPQALQPLLSLLQGQSTGALNQLSAFAQQLLNVLSGQTPTEIGTPPPVTGLSPEISRTAEQLKQVLQGLAALGSAGSSQSNNQAKSDAPTPTELRLGLQSLLSSLRSLGLLPQTNASTFTSLTGGNTSNTQAISTITGNFQTDPELLKILQENLNQALQTQQRQINQASLLFNQSQEVVQKFVSLIQEDTMLLDLIQSDELSDEQQTLFDGRMNELRKDLGIEWGTEDPTPSGQTNLVTRAMQSGMMV